MGNGPAKADFLAALGAIWAEAQEQGADHIDVVARELHRRVGGYPGPNHRMATCCDAMHGAMEPGDQIRHSPPKGRSTTLEIRYHLPRKAAAIGQSVLHTRPARRGSASSSD